ncbi:glycoside hydrolase/phage tail family protein [Phaeobacter inhibens]|uniref:baseplate multidomain protein megatron n=1 Tax=Phaeobacter inhibens TaxID=221822 RepID=UPI0021A89162|nr:glycoside hydrolase/phage tail family protein [Phaeobacter inhibens]UWR74683.1 glycoside hydrolase/phage tail family protein [Phaeobacter inhibens]
MATILLSAAGAALGGSVGGAVAGLSSVAIGRALGATVGRAIDSRLLGAGSEPVETGRVERFRLTHASDGQPIAQVYGRMRVGGQVIWASQFRETSTTSGGGGKGGGSRQPKVTSYSYDVSLAVAVCAGEVASIGRVWADGEEVAPKDLNMTVYRGTMDQLPDPVIEAVEGAGEVPAYRGTAYVVMESLALERFGNRVPQFSFEVLRAEQPASSTYDLDLPQLVQGVALMPGTGEYALASTPVHYDHGPGQAKPANSHSPSGETDLVTSLTTLGEELPACGAASLIVSWFGNDLRCGACTVKPKVERQHIEGANMPWSVAGLTRTEAELIARQDDRPIYGGTPTDASVIEAIRAMQAQGKRVMFYPFILMDQMAGNDLPDPWSGEPGQAHLPWRGRITLSRAPGQPGSPDGTATARMEVQQFFGTATAADFTVADGAVTYSGPLEDWGLRRFILHNAALCAAAGGVEAFCISSEMRGLTQIRDEAGFPAVAELRALTQEVRQILGPDTQIGYAADWSEYWGYQSPEGDRYFHLDPLWADEQIDFIGIDNYMPLSDWREGEEHLDAKAGAPNIYDLSYLRANIEGGEGYDWYYHSPEAEVAQIRTPITDGAYHEPWIWRYKDLRSWWSKPHHDRINGQRAALPTAWEPQSKPIWFTELGCAAIDKGTNQPNKFLDPKSSESKLPKFSDGQRDDMMQLAYLRALLGYWQEEGMNPVSEVYDGPMLDMSNAYVWAWDARPFPTFPNAVEVWSDGENYLRGHWLNGRVGQRTLASVLEEICAASGVAAIDVSDLPALVRGYAISDVGEARAALQPLLLRHGVDAIERDGLLRFRLRNGRQDAALDLAQLVEGQELDGVLEQTRAPEAELAGRMRLRFVEWGGRHDLRGEEAVLPDEATHAVSDNELPMALTRAEGRQVVERWLSEARMARDTLRLELPPSAMALGAGDVIRLPLAGAEAGPEVGSEAGPEVGSGAQARYRIDRVEQGAGQLIEAVRIEPENYHPAPVPEELPGVTAFAAPVPVLPLFMDLPLIGGDEVPHAPHLAVTAQPWPGSVALYGAQSDADYVLEEVLAAASTIAITNTVLPAGALGRWERGADLEVDMITGQFQSRDRTAVLNGANLVAIGDGSPGNWELLQFAKAELIAPGRYLLRDRLRGQQGSDARMPVAWPKGSYVVALDGTPQQITLAANQRGLSRHYRIGTARRPYDDPSYVHLEAAFAGEGLRPYAPVHLRQKGVLGSGAVGLDWIRRSRTDGDRWDLAEIPLGEDLERYRLRVLRGSDVLREELLDSPGWSYPVAAQTADAVAPGDRVEVAQVSARYGAGAATARRLV